MPDDGISQGNAQFDRYDKNEMGELIQNPQFVLTLYLYDVVQKLRE
jgi:hypothetical protein